MYIKFRLCYHFHGLDRLNFRLYKWNEMLRSPSGRQVVYKELSNFTKLQKMVLNIKIKVLKSNFEYLNSYNSRSVTYFTMQV